MTLLRAVKKLRDNGIDNIKIHFVGDGPTIKSCKNLPLNIKYLVIL